MRTENMGSDNLEPSDDQSTDSGAFFNKYTPRQSPEPEAGNKFFRKYVVDQDEPAGESDEPQELDPSLMAAVPEYTTRPAPAFIRLKLLAGLIGVAILLGLLYATNRHSSSPGESTPPTVEDMAARPESRSDEAQPEVQLNEAETEEKPDKTAPPPQRAKNSSFRSSLFASMLARAHRLEDMDRLNEAAKVYQDILNEFPDEQSSQIALNRIQNSFFARQRDESARTAREAGLKKFRMGDYPGAEADLAVAVNAGRTDTATLYALGMSYLNLKDHSKAMATLGDCIASNPDYAPALVGLAQAKLFDGEKEQALSLLNRALELGGGAEFTPVKIRDMISGLDSKKITLQQQPRGYFFAYAVHRHSFPLVWCRGQLTINNSVVEFRSNKPSHGFRISTTALTKAAQSGDELVLVVKGEPYRFTLEGKSVRDFFTALNP